jgi:hypothetical protein
LAHLAVAVVLAGLAQLELDLIRLAGPAASVCHHQ